MTILKRRLNFLLWFARQDLFARHARRTTRVILSTVAILTGFTLLVYGLVLGNECVRLERLKRDPLALCLWVQAGDGPLGNHLTEDRLDALRNALAQALPLPGAFRGCSPVREVDLDWYLESDAPSGRTTKLSGRTLAPGDPFLREWPLQAGRPLTDSNEHGVVVAKDMLDMLGKAATSPPLTLRVRSAEGTAHLVTVVGVSPTRFPHDHLYALTEAYYEELLTEVPTAALERIYTGPLPDELVRQKELPAAALAVLNQLNLMATAESLEERRVWQLSSLEGKPPLRAWRQYVKQLRKVLVSAGYPLDDAFERITVAAEDRPPAPPKKGHDLAAVYLGDLPDLTPAAAAARSIGLEPLEDVIKQIEAINHAARLAVLVLTWVVVVVGGISCWNVSAIQELRAYQKTAEIGMLKAMGMSDRLLRQVFVTEAALLWGLGCGAGMLLGLAGGWGSAWWLAESPAERFLAFRCPWYLAAAVAGACATAVWTSTLYATRAARRAPPSETLHTP
jgi:hypothetical protein